MDYYNLKNLKEMVRKQMYQALLAIVFFGSMGVLGVIGIITGLCERPGNQLSRPNTGHRTWMRKSFPDF